MVFHMLTNCDHLWEGMFYVCEHIHLPKKESLKLNAFDSTFKQNNNQNGELSNLERPSAM